MDREKLQQYESLLQQHIAGELQHVHSLPDSPFLCWAIADRKKELPEARFEDDALWLRVMQQDDSAAPPISDAGMLFPDCHANRALEVWTECELSALQALVWIALHQQSQSLLTRAADAASWHIEHTQPDNATNHPWGIPAFLLLAIFNESCAPEAELYASTLLHNCLVTTGEPDAFSSLVLRDARAQILSLLESSLLV